jgi:hypothetical protein
MQDQQYFPVNWADGMKINKSHFVAQENATVAQHLQTIGALLNDYNYGLLPPTNAMSFTPGVYVNVDNQQQVQVRLQHLKVITRGGYFFQFNGDVSPYNKALSAPIPHLSVPFQDLKGRADAFYIILSLNPYTRNPYGQPDPEESPVRIPYTIPSFNLDLLPVSDNITNLIGSFHIPIAKIYIEEQRVMLDNDYVPPCCFINSHSDLVEILAGLEQFYSKTEMYLLQIIQKIQQKKQANEMSAIVFNLCDKLLVIMSSQVSEIKTLAANQSPVILINKLTCLARLLKNTLDYYIGSGKEELMNYCAKWCQVNQGELESVLTGLSNYQYNHLDVNAGVEKVLQFTRTVSTLFNNLSKLDYIGIKNDVGIFVNEKASSYVPDEPIKKRKSFLAE